MRLAPTGVEIAPIITISKAPLRKIAYELARAFRIEQGYDSLMFPSIRTPLESVIAWVLVIDQEAVGVVFTERLQSRWVDKALQPTNSTSVEGIFIASAYRRKGWGKKLLIAVAAQANCEVAQLCFRTPFSANGKALIYSVVPAADVRLSGEVR